MGAGMGSGASAALDEERLRWIETWAKGWASSVRLNDVLRSPDAPSYYASLPLDVAVSMIEELVVALRDPHHAIAVLADTMESGQEIGEAVEDARGVRRDAASQNPVVGR